MRGASRVIDVHVHGIPPVVLERVREARVDGVSVEGAPSGRPTFRFPDMEASPPAPEGLFDFAGMARWGRDRGIDHQLIGPWTDLLGYTLDPDAAERWSLLYNEELAGSCAAQPGLEPLGTIPLQAPDAALRVLESARSLGCRGFVVGTDVPFGDLAGEQLDPVWDALVRAGMPVLVHPTFLTVSSDLRGDGLKNAVGRAAATTQAIARLTIGGVLERHPSLSLIMAHGGGGFVALIDRIVRSHELGWSNSDVDIVASIGRLYWDSVVLDPRYLAFVVEKVGSDRVLLGSDHPFPWEPDPVGTVERAIALGDQAAILGRNAAALFGLEQ